MNVCVCVLPNEKVFFYLSFCWSSITEHLWALLSSESLDAVVEDEDEGF